MFAHNRFIMPNTETVQPISKVIEQPNPTTEATLGSLVAPRQPSQEKGEASAVDLSSPEKRWGKMSRSEEDAKFLEGPRGRLEELKSAVSVFWEMIKGFRSLHFVGPCVTVFGSARYKEDHPYYQLAREVGKEIAERGFAVMTGGGPGIMEAANRGAKDAGGYSIGSNIKLPKEESANPYLDKWVDFDSFMIREAMLRKYSYGFIVMPGGIGTMQEIFEPWVLMQTGKMKNFPMVLMDKEYWSPLMDFIKTRLLATGAISSGDLDNILVTDSPQEAVDYVYKHSIANHGLRHLPSPSSLLGESGRPKVNEEGPITLGR